MKIPVFLSLVVAMALGMLLGTPLIGLKLSLAALFGGAALAAMDRHYGYWQPLAPLWRRDGEYLLGTLLAVLLAGYATSPFLKPLPHPWVGGLFSALGALGVTQVIELVVAWRQRG